MPTIERERGLYKNGSRWWLRVHKVPRSTGTSDLVVANRVKRMVDELGETPKTAHWLEADVDLLTLFKHRSAGTLHQLQETITAGEVDDIDPDLDPWVKKWDAEHLVALVANQKITETVRQQYLRQVRALIPAGVRFPRSKFTEDGLKKALSSLTDARSGKALTGSTRRRYFVAWKLFYRFARKRVPLGINPFDEADWMPANNSARSVYWDHETTMAVLKHMTGEPRIVMALIFGSGGELGTEDNGGVLKMEGRHIQKNDEHTIIVPGSKNQYREDRTIFLDEWAWKIVEPHVKGIKPRQSLWATIDTEGQGDEVRDAFYAAQVEAGVVNEPPKSETTGKPLWGAVDPHRIHDARHTYCYVRLTGDDGEPRQSVKFCSQQLGHGDEQMVSRVYAKSNIETRIRLIELKEARRQAK